MTSNSGDFYGNGLLAKAIWEKALKDVHKMSSFLCFAPALGLGIEGLRVEAHDSLARGHDGKVLKLLHLGWLVGLS
jgi:hypothetical protein